MLISPCNRMPKRLLDAPVQRAARVLKLQLKPIRSFFPPDAGQEEMQETIQKALEYYFRKQESIQ